MVRPMVWYGLVEVSPYLGDRKKDEEEAAGVRAVVRQAML